jgi:hypothetical protein
MRGYAFKGHHGIPPFDLLLSRCRVLLPYFFLRCAAAIRFAFEGA